MTALLLAPHNDDETLFAAFTCLRERPHVVVCTYPYVQEHVQGHASASAEIRQAETAAAMEILGCSWEQWAYLDTPEWPDWTLELFRQEFDRGPDQRGGLLARGYDRVYAPAVEEGGHVHHNLVGQLADEFFGELVTHYMTYTGGRSRSTGVRVEYENEWIAAKLCALACYESQILLESTGHHFAQALDEWYQP